ncbi:KIN14B-interacting protein At4g14310 [Salvia miltiorrhiza]|uniref:KIN14B-interacting protein At4g14310 n=1 Tax=Salvia miltiorrhiza TaxID=226208 RepID=UPI0025AC9E62|nr:KIN14B-interacting protein At4g14310 [Salvia miltiorrhiza]
MSTAPVRRIKERGGGGGKISAAPAAGKVSPMSGRSVSTGKENPRPTSLVRGATQKPTLKPMARVDKSVAPPPPAEETRSRRSTSSVPRGRSSSPSEFTRVLSDLRKNSSRVYMGSGRGKESGVNLKGLNVKSDIEKRVGKDLAKNGGFVGELKKDKIHIRVVNDGRSDIKEDILGSVAMGTPNLENRVLKDFKKNVEDPNGGFQGNEKLAVTVLTGDSVEKEQKSSSVVKMSDIEEVCSKSGLEVGLKSSKFTDEVKIMKSSMVGVVPSRESKMVSKVSSCPGAPRENAPNKYPSKLHEKLAFLEGKVKRIASDIKRTKEMLDMNNPDASKMILSDIQEKITGIEKAMVYVSSSDVKTVENSRVEKEEKELRDTQYTAKGLNEELEARLFPHHKLIRDRTLFKATVRGSETCVSEVGESKDTLIVGEKATIFEDNAIAVELLASLSKVESHVGGEASELQEMDDSKTCIAESSSINALNDKVSIDAFLKADEKLNEFDDEERLPGMTFGEEVEEDSTYKLNDIGRKTSTGGWFVSEGESVLLAHDDGYCSFYDISNSEEKAEYKPPAGVVPNIWQDCWIIRAPSADGCSERYVVAASAGNSAHSGFCSWDFYSKKIRAYHFEDETARVRTALAPLSNNTMHGRFTLSTAMAAENQQWWYKPCGPLIMSGSSYQRMVQLYDIRDGLQVMKWDLQRPLCAMDYASPLQWRNRGKVAVAESDSISVWDVSCLSSQALLSVSSSGRRISALHVNNTDAELGGGVRQRVSSAEAEGNDGVFCTSDSINVLDFRQPSGIAFKIPKVGVDVQSAFSHGDSIYIGCSTLRSAVKKQYSSQIQQFSLRKQRLFSTYTLPESNAHSHFTALTQVWGSSNYVMGVCGLGLFVFDSLKDDGLPSYAMDYNSSQNVKEIIGPDNMYYPSFDYLSSRVLLISKDRPAQWRYLF